MHQYSDSSFSDWQTRDRRHVWHPFTPLNSELPVLPVVKGEGVWLRTADGKKILDAISSWWVNLHGHAQPAIAQAIARQAQQLEHVIFAGFTHPGAIQLAEKLLHLLPGKQALIFYSDNGSTAVEVALKMALQYWHNQGIKKQRIIALEGAYHGDTFGAMSVGERGGFNVPFEKHLFAVDFVPFPAPGNEEACLEKFRQLLGSGEVAAFIFEPLVQGSAGMRMYQPALLDKMLHMAHEAKVLCIADEVMTGFGRTDKLFACNYLSQQPDLVCVSKGITGGFMPLGVTACTAAVAQAFRGPHPATTFFHGHSYTANPLACAAALASLELLLSQECSNQRELISDCHQQFMQSIAGHPALEDVRSLGTILALSLKTGEASSYFNSKRNQLYNYFLERNILLRPLGNVIYLMPPYVIGKSELQQVYAAIRELLAQEQPN